MGVEEIEKLRFALRHLVDAYRNSDPVAGAEAIGYAVAVLATEATEDFEFDGRDN